MQWFQIAFKTLLSKLVNGTLNWATAPIVSTPNWATAPRLSTLNWETAPRLSTPNWAMVPNCITPNWDMAPTNLMSVDLRFSRVPFMLVCLGLLIGKIFRARLTIIDNKSMLGLHMACTNCTSDQHLIPAWPQFWSEQSACASEQMMCP
jgi:hypothetical protein